MKRLVVTGIVHAVAKTSRNPMVLDITVRTVGEPSDSDALWSDENTQELLDGLICKTVTLTLEAEA